MQMMPRLGACFRVFFGRASECSLGVFAVVEWLCSVVPCSMLCMDGGNRRDIQSVTPGWRAWKRYELLFFNFVNKGSRSEQKYRTLSDWNERWVLATRRRRPAGNNGGLRKEVRRQAGGQRAGCPWEGGDGVRWDRVRRTRMKRTAPRRGGGVAGGGPELAGICDGRRVS